MNGGTRRDAEQHLREAESELSAGRTDRAWELLLAAYDEAQTGVAEGEISLFGRTLLLRWLEVSRTGNALADPERRAVLRRRLLDGASSLVRLSRIVEEVVSLFLVTLRDRHPDALELYVAIVEEMPNLSALDVRQQKLLLRTLSEGLKVRLEDDPEEARSRRPLLERLHRARPGLSFVRLYLARTDALMGRFDRALELLEGMSGELARHPKTLTLRGLCAERTRDWSAAESSYRESLAARPQAVVHHCLGRLLLHRALAEDGVSAPL